MIMLTYIIKFPNDFKKFKCNVEYYADFRLLKLCEEGTLKELLKHLV